MLPRYFLSSYSPNHAEQIAFGATTSYTTFGASASFTGKDSQNTYFSFPITNYHASIIIILHLVSIWFFRLFIFFFFLFYPGLSSSKVDKEEREYKFPWVSTYAQYIKQLLPLRYQQLVITYYYLFYYFFLQDDSSNYPITLPLREDRRDPST